MTDIIDYKDYTFVKDGFTGLYDVVLDGKVVDSSLPLNSAYYVAEDHWNTRYGIKPAVWENDREHNILHTYEVTGVIVRGCTTIDPAFTCIIDAERMVLAQMKAKMKVSVNYGKNALLRDVKVKKIGK